MKLVPFADLDCSDQPVLLRLDLNVPMQHGSIVDDERIIRAVPTIQSLLQRGAKLLVVSHLGRPKPGANPDDFTLAPVALRLQQLLGQAVPLCRDWQIAPPQIASGQLVLLENIRLNAGETENDPCFAAKLCSLANLLVMDAFATCHRIEASTVGIIALMKVGAIGPLIASELDHLQQALENPVRPLVVIVGGAKITTKIKLLYALMTKADYVMVGGAMAHTILLEQGYQLGKSLVEPDSLVDVKKLLQSQQHSQQLLLPEDVIVVKQFAASAKTTSINIKDLAEDDCIIDIGEKTRAYWQAVIQSAKTVVWNGPVGLFEWQSGAGGTHAIIDGMRCASKAYRVAGGGDTLLALKQSSGQDCVDYASTGGGAFLTWLEQGGLPVLAAMGVSGSTG